MAEAVTEALLPGRKVEVKAKRNVSVSEKNILEKNLAKNIIRAAVALGPEAVAVEMMIIITVAASVSLNKLRRGRRLMISTDSKKLKCE